MWFAPAHQLELQQRWVALGQELAIDGNVWNAEGKRLISSWACWPRKYHNTPHLYACLQHFSRVRDQLNNPPAVALALWFHDAVYWPWLPQNEEKSAEWATGFMRKMGLDPALTERVNQLILDTRHQALPGPGDAQWMVDIDLAILGQTSAVYQQFEKDVRREYRWVRWPSYVKGRSAVLQSFLDRSRIYNTDSFFERYEASARHNLTRALAALSLNKLY